MTTLAKYLVDRAATTPTAPAYAERSDARWETTSWSAFARRVASLVAGLDSAEVPGRGAPLAIMAPSSLAWETLHTAALWRGMFVVGVDAHDVPERVADVLDRTDAKVLAVETLGLWERLPEDTRRQITHLIVLEGDPGLGMPLEALLAASPTGNGPACNEDDTATVIFTSGSSGAPKGVAYTHGQVSAAVSAILAAFPEIDEGDRLACWLPLSNLFQRILNLCGMARGTTTYFVPDPRALMSMVAEIRPHMLIGVPRFFEKFVEGVDEQIHGKPAPVRQVLRWAQTVGTEHARMGAQCSTGLRVRYGIADRLVLRRLRAALGGELKFMVSGSAPLPLGVLERFDALGIPVLEAYGLSENVVPVAANRVHARRPGTVGRPLEGNEVTIAPDGEVLVRGIGVSKAYLGADVRPEVDEAGFLHTGDLGELDEAGFLTLKGRKSEIFKTSTGRKVAPSAVESCLRTVPQVDQAVLVGAERKFVVALLAPAATDQAWDAAQLTQDLDRALVDVPAYARPAGAALLAAPFSIQGGELTANLKLRRPAVAEKYAAIIDSVYQWLEDGADEKALPDGTVILSLEQDR